MRRHEQTCDGVSGLPGEVAPVFLESKRKLHRNVVKHRIRVGDTQAWSDGDSIRPWRDAVQNHGDPRGFARRWLEAVDSVDMRAVCHVTYVRETWVQGRCRLTIDHDLRAHARPDPRELQAHAAKPLLHSFSSECSGLLALTPIEPNANTAAYFAPFRAASSSAFWMQSTHFEQKKSRERKKNLIFSGGYPYR